MYTYRYSTEPSLTITLRCPVCVTPRPITQNHLQGTWPTLQEICCPEHVKVWQEKVYTTEKIVWKELKGRVRLPSKVAKRVRTTGCISNLVQKFLGNK